jgi:hypothetical protein
MATEYLEEYLVSLGFDLNSKDGQDYIKMLDEISRRQKEAEKSGQAADAQSAREHTNSRRRVEDGRKEIDVMRSMEAAGSRLNRIMDEISQGNPFGAIVSGIQGVNFFAEFIKSLGQQQAPELQNAAPRGQQNNTAPGGQQPQQQTNTAGAEQLAAQAAQEGIRTEQGLAAGMTGQAASGATAGAGGGAGVLSGIGAAAGPAAAVVAVVAAVTALAVSAEKLAEGISEVNTGIETMSRRMWITDSEAWKLQNTLTAMGKTLGDLNDIALNPILRQQFNELMEAQNSLSLPEDFIEQNESWANSVTAAQNQLKLAKEQLKEIGGYELQKIFEKPMTDLANLQTLFTDFLGITLRWIGGESSVWSGGWRDAVPGEWSPFRAAVLQLFILVCEQHTRRDQPASKRPNCCDRSTGRSTRNRPSLGLAGPLYGGDRKHSKQFEVR